MDYTLTDLEKKVLRECLTDGFFGDNYDPHDLDKTDSFITYGVHGKRERGAIASLVKKGVVEVIDFRGIRGCRNDEIHIYSKMSDREILTIAGFDPENF